MIDRLRQMRKVGLGSFLEVDFRNEDIPPLSETDLDGPHIEIGLASDSNRSTEYTMPVRSTYPSIATRDWIRLATVRAYPGFIAGLAPGFAGGQFLIADNRFYGG